MTVQTTESGIIRLGDGVVREFSFSFQALDPQTIMAAVVVDGVLEMMAPGSYTVDLSESSPGGSILFDEAPASGATVYIFRETEPLQLVGVSSQNRYDPKVVERVWDKLTILIQETIRETQGSLRVLDADLDPIVPETGKTVLWNGTAFIPGPSGDEIANAQSFAELAEAWAESVLPPDPTKPESKSAKTWAGEAEASAGRIDLGALDAAVEATGADALATFADRTQTDLDRTQTGADRVQTGLDVAGAAVARTAAEAARDAALLSRGVFVSTAAGLSSGVAAVTVTAAGSGGTNGTFALAFSGGAGTGVAGTFTVAGGAVVSVTITHPGTGYTSAPTVSFAASSGLTGVTATVAIAPRNPVGTYFSVPATGNDSLILFRVDAGPVAAEVTRYPAASTIPPMRRALGFPLSSKALTPNSGSVTPTCFRAFTTSNGTAYRLSAVVQTGGIRYVQLIQGGVPAGGGVNAIFDLQALTASAAFGTPDIQEIGGGFVEIGVTGEVVSAAGSVNWQIRPSQTGAWPYSANGTDRLIVDLFRLTAVGSSVNLFPTDDITDAAFTKTSCAAVVANSAEIQTIPALYETRNVVNEIDILLRGKMTGWRLTEGSGAGLETRMFHGANVASGQTCVFSVIAKAGERTRLNLLSVSGAVMDGRFDLADGVATGAGATITRIGNGWYLCSVSVVASATTSTNLQVRVLGASGFPPRTGDGVSGLFVQAASFAINGGPNLLAADFSLAAWTKQGLTVTANQALYVGLQNDILNAQGTGAHPLAGRRVVVLGTSLVAQDFWTSVFQSLTGCILTNLGESGGSYGLSSDYTDPRIGLCSARLNTTDIPADTALIIADMGVNDPLWRVPLGTVSDTTTATFAGAMANVSIWAAANRPAAEVVYTQLTSAEPTFPTHRHGGLASGGLATVAPLEDYQNMLARIARREGRLLIDPNNAGISWRTAGIRGDGLHWNTLGGALVAKIYDQKIRHFYEAGWSVTS